jgi:hypothetical protein
VNLVHTGRNRRRSIDCWRKTSRRPAQIRCVCRRLLRRKLGSKLDALETLLNMCCSTSPFRRTFGSRESKER